MMLYSASVAASQEAMRDSHLVIDDSNRYDISVMVGAASAAYPRSRNN